MGELDELLTARLRMRRWRGCDREPLAAINCDPFVMEHFPAPLTRAQSDELIAEIESHFERHSYGLWALQERTSGELIGFTGLEVVTFQARFTPAVEIGWRLARSAWGHGYASEAALAAPGAGFERAGLDQVVSFTALANERSQAVMRRIGMSHDRSDDFEHPGVPPLHSLSRHMLFRITAAEWARR